MALETLQLAPNADPVALLAARIAVAESVIWLAPNEIVADDLRSRWGETKVRIITTRETPEPASLLIVSRLMTGVDEWIAMSDSAIQLVGPLDDPSVKPKAATTAEPKLIRHEAAGKLGESRLAARQIRRWIDVGIETPSIVVTSRDPDSMRAYLTESLNDVGVEMESYAVNAWNRSPAVAMLLKALRLPLDDFPFADVTALLRSTYLRRTTDAEPRNAALTLRLLGRTRGRTNFLEALDEWAIAPPMPLEDEGVDRIERERRGRFANQSRGYLTNWFALGDRLPAAASPAAWLTAIKSFARELLTDDEAMTAFLTMGESAEVDESSWTMSQAVEWLTRQAARLDDRPVSPNRRAVRFVPAESARHLPCDALIVLDLGEGSFPRADKTSDDDLRGERLLFHDLLRRPTREVVLSFAATNEDGEKLLPAAFLQELVTKRKLGIADVTQSMPLDRFAEGPASSHTERRIQAARRLYLNSTDTVSGLSDDEIHALRRLRLVAAERFDNPTFAAFDGMLAEPTAIAKVANKNPPDKAFGVSSLEMYAECPFKYWMERVLSVAAAKEPSDDPEQFQRGRAIHRGLARHHRDGQEDLAEALSEAVEEYRGRSGSKLHRVLWELEARRMARTARRYGRQVAKFKEQTAKVGLTPRPAYFEESFGSRAHPMSLEHGDESVRVVGTIDRIDVAEDADGVAYWIIDYKTGAASLYSAKAVEEMRILQLPVYAMAAERLIGEAARPAGLVYWLLGHKDGAKNVMPKKVDWEQLKVNVSARLVEVAREIRHGRFPLDPVDDDCTSHCDYSTACRIAQSRSLGKT